MSKSRIDIDDEALADAAKFYGTTGKRDTINTALREAAQRLHRREAFDRLAEIVASSEFDFLLDKRNYRR